MAIHKESSAEAAIVFEEASKAARDESDYIPYQSHFKQVRAFFLLSHSIDRFRRLLKTCGQTLTLKMIKE